MKIRAIITDFDGTLVDTFEANYQAYHQAFANCGLCITREQYRECFGCRFDAFMERMGIRGNSMRERIRKEKAYLYPQCFDSLIPNQPLISFISKLKASGIKTAIASTAQQENLMNALSHLRLTHLFDEIIAGTHVMRGKPDPEIYLNAMEILGVCPQEALIFEDTEVGLQAADASGANYLRITSAFFNCHENPNQFL